ncbi:MAG: biotin carboxyl carrier protein [Myxococcota bacterium]|jgi:biotin carboxyl carrier protein
MMNRRFIARVDELADAVTIEIISDNGHLATVEVTGEDGATQRLTLDVSGLGDDRYLVRDGDSVEVMDVVELRANTAVLAGADAIGLTVVDERDTWLGTGGGSDGDGVVTVAMPGKVVAIDVEVGEEVTRGQRLLIIEAMKMENDVKSPRDGIVKSVRVTPGAAVEAGEPLVELE